MLNYRAGKVSYRILGICQLPLSSSFISTTHCVAFVNEQFSELGQSNSQNWANQILRTGKISYSNDENVGESIVYAEREDLSAFKVGEKD